MGKDVSEAVISKAVAFGIFARAEYYFVEPCAGIVVAYRAVARGDFFCSVVSGAYSSAKQISRMFKNISTFFDFLRLYFSILKYVGQHLFFGAANIFSIHRAAGIRFRFLRQSHILSVRRDYDSYTTAIIVIVIAQIQNLSGVLLKPLRP